MLLECMNFFTIYQMQLHCDPEIVIPPILRQLSKFCIDRSNRCGDIAIFVIFQDSGRRHLGFLKIRNFNGTSAVRVQYASLYQISSKSVKRLKRYGDLTVFKMVVVRYLGFVGCL